jgi:hypothetical protein
MPPTITLQEALAKREEETIGQIERVRQCGARRAKEIEEVFLAAQLLEGHGVSVTITHYSPHYLWVDTEEDREMFRRAVQALGGMRQSSVSVIDGKKRLVKKEYRPKAFPQVSVSLVVRLPKKRKGMPRPKCQIKRVRVKGYWTTQLVCEGKE